MARLRRPAMALGVVAVRVWEASSTKVDPVGVVDVGLSEDRSGGVVHRGEQVDLRAWVVAAAA